jgi:Putative transposase
VQAIGRQSQRAPDGAPVHYERHRPEQTTLCRLVQQHAATFFAQAEAEAEAGADLPQFVKDELDAFLECGILTLPTASCDCAAVTAATTSWSRSAASGAGFARRAVPGAWCRQQPPGGPRHPSCARAPVGAAAADPPAPGTGRTAQAGYTRTAGCAPRGHSVLLKQAGVKAEEAKSGAVTLIQRFGSAANLNIHLHCLVLDGVYRRSADGTPEFVEVPAPTDEALQSVLHKIITRTMKLLTRQGVLVEEEGSTYMADSDSDSDDARVLARRC